MGTINRDGKRIKLKAFTFTSLANTTASYDIQQPGDANTLLGFNIYPPSGGTTQGKKMSLTVNSLQIIDNIDATEANPILNRTAKTMLTVSAPLAGNDTIKLQFSELATVGTYIINLYYLY